MGKVMERTPREQLESALAYTESRVEFYKARAEEERKEAKRLRAKINAMDAAQIRKQEGGL